MTCCFAGGNVYFSHRPALPEWRRPAGAAIDREEGAAEEIATPQAAPVLYVNHIEARGRPFFEKVCELDLEGILAKRKTAAYRPTEKPSLYWVKIKNPKYSRAKGREELFNPKSDGIVVPSV